MATVGKIVEIGLIVIAVLLLMGWFFGKTGMGNSIVKSIGEVFIENLPIKGETKYDDDSAMISAFGGIASDILFAKKTPDTECFISMDTLPADFDGKIIFIEQSGNDINVSLVNSKDGRRMHREPVKDMSLCTISKNSATVRGFHDKFFEGDMPRDDVQPLSKVEMVKNARVFFGIFPGREGIFLDDKKYEMVAPMLYKPSAGEVCFMPLVDHDSCIPTEGGLSYPCVDAIKNSQSFKRCAPI